MDIQVGVKLGVPRCVPGKASSNEGEVQVLRAKAVLGLALASTRSLTH